MCLVSSVFTAIFICIVCGLRKKIKTSIEVLEETSKALSQQPSTFAVPICTLIAQIGFIALWAVTTAYIMSSSETVADVENNNYVMYVVTDTQYVAFIYMLFALFWFTQLFVAMEEFVVGSVIVIWYASGKWFAVCSPMQCNAVRTLCAILSGCLMSMCSPCARNSLWRRCVSLSFVHAPASSVCVLVCACNSCKRT